MSEVGPKPDGVENIYDEPWEELTSYQRWYCKNREEHIENVSSNDRKRIEENQQKLKEYKKKRKCNICGFDDYRALTFHHVDPEDKKGSISQLIGSGYSWETVLEEIEKCQIVCSNCHKIIHYDE